jgi:indole-3-glycerol phosphate synthase
MILDEIVRATRRELQKIKHRMPLEALKKMASEQSPPDDLASALRGEGMKLIAEVKKASPSRGVICADFDPVKIARMYAENGASAISVLTETRHFQGSMNYLRDIKSALGSRCPPLLRKDFIIDPYQIYQSRAYGADSLLLIAAILKPEELTSLLKLSHGLGMNCLVEVHNEAEVGVAIKSNAGIIGINNRDLTTFRVDLTTTGRLRPLIPAGRIVVSESGIKNRNDVEMLKEWGVNAVLIGEALMSAPDIAARMKELF